MSGTRALRYAPIVVAILAVASSISGITNGFALDDVQLIAANDRLHHLSHFAGVFSQPYWGPEEGSSLYRPLTSLAFLLQWVAGNGSPLVFHIVSIALYAAVSVAVLQFAMLITDERVAFISAGLFAVHPLHTEAVANVVGQAELWSALFAIVGLSIYIRGRNAGAVDPGTTLKVCACYAIALLFKEHVIVLPAIIAAYELTGNRRIRNAVPALIGMSATAAAFIAIRTAVLGQIQGGGVSPVFAGEGFDARFFTMLRVSTQWMRLFFWPATLSADYSPSQIPIATGFQPDMLPGVLVIASALLLAVRYRKTHPAISFACLSAGILLLIPSNLVVVTGFLLAERTLFLPSVMVMIAAVAVVSFTFDSVDIVRADRPRAVRFAILGVSLLAVAGVARSAVRNPVWSDNESLIIHTVIDAPRSARAHMMMAQLLSDHGNQPKAIDETVVALGLGSPRDSQLFAFAADMFQMAGNCQVASGLYTRSLNIRPDQPQVRVNAQVCQSHLASLNR